MNPQPSWEELQPYYDEGYDPYDPMHGSDSDDEQELTARDRPDYLATFLFLRGACVRRRLSARMHAVRNRLAPTPRRRVVLILSKAA